MVHFAVEEAEHLERSHLAHAFRHIRVGEREQHHQCQTAGERHNQRHHRAHEVEFEAVGHMRAAYGLHHRTVLFERFRIVGLRGVGAGKLGEHGVPRQSLGILGTLGILGVLRVFRVEKLGVVGFAYIHIRADEVAIHRAHLRRGLHAVAVGQSHLGTGLDAQRACRRLRDDHAIVIEFQRTGFADAGRAQYAGRDRLQRDHFAQIGQMLFRHRDQLDAFAAAAAGLAAVTVATARNRQIARLYAHVKR